MDSLLYSKDTLAFMGVDPGTNHLGVAKIDFDPRSGLIVQTSAITCIAEQYVSYDTSDSEDSDLRRYKRLKWHENNLYHLFTEHQPVQVAVETNYISRGTPSAYGPLVESVFCIRNAAYRYYDLLPVIMVDPMSAKKSVEAKTRGLSKEENKLAVWKALGELNHILKIPEPIYRDLSQHASDAIAIAYCAFSRWYYNTQRRS